ncbi:MAG: VWA domain-containing protein [Bacteroidales bacterium]|nr:VWA domain-containing protein [Bacteroidales bacterium]MBN2756681.1 VWA domain-containing protein [Bacteroidales bacterium]
MKNNNYDDLNFNLDFANFNPDDIEVDETINAVFIIDTSSSVYQYVNELNYAFNDFTESMQKSHIADKLFVSVIEFNNKINVVNGFMPISSIQNMDFSKKLGGATALYDAVYHGLNNALDYRENLENSGVKTKTMVFVITDGEDNSSKNSANSVKNIIKKIKADELSAFSFTTILFGLGDEANFEKARIDMGIEHLAKIGTSGAEIKKMIGFISQSISSVSAGQPTFAPVF